MTERLFDQDSYIKEFSATVIGCEKVGDFYKTELDKTAFFPEGGGQKGDTGTLNGISVLDTQEEDGIIYHYTSDFFEKGASVTGVLDWDKRFYKMQNHTAEHIISGLVHKKFGYDNSGFHLGDDFVTMDFNGFISQEAIDAIEREANRLIWECRFVKAYYPENLSELSYRSKLDLKDNVRIVDIEGIDSCACCAPHVKNTAEIGMIKIFSCQKYKGGVRITAKSGMFLYNELCTYHSTLKQLSSLLSLPAEDTATGVKNLLSRIDTMNYEMNGLKSQILKAELKDSNTPFFFTDSLDIKEAVNILKEQFPNLCGAFLGNDADGFRFMIYTENLEVIKATLKEKFNASAGGRDNMLQGLIKASRNEIENFFSFILTEENSQLN